MTLVRGAPPIVLRACADAGEHVAIRVTCPRLVPRSAYVRRTGLWGGEAPTPRLWFVTFNNGDNGPAYVHWIAGAGTRRDVARHVLGDTFNVVKGLPARVSEQRVGGRRVVGYRFPPHPAGGPNGGHVASFVDCGPLIVYASIHGDGNGRAAEAMALDLARLSGCPSS